jgi:hypothetical protein
LDTDLAGGELLAGDAAGEFFGDGRGDAGLAGVDGADGVEQLVDGHSLEQIGAGSCLECAVDVLVAVEGGEDDEAGGGRFGADAGDGVDAAELGELQVHEGDVGSEGAVEGDGFESVGGFADDLDAGHDLEERDETLADDVVVVDDQDANWRGGVGHTFVPFAGRIGASRVRVVPLPGELSRAI